MDRHASFASRLRWWRKHRGVSQLELAARAQVSQRHVSFLEVGRSAPSREMALRLASVLELPLREQNALLLAAGYAPMWRESAFGAPELALVDQALDFILAQQEPYPAVVVDRRWNLLRANQGGQYLLAFLTDSPVREPDPARPLNLADAFMAPGPVRPLIMNWREIAYYFIRSVHADALADGSEESAALLRRLLDYPDIPEVSQIPAIEEPQAPVLALHFAKGETSLKLFTTIATLGTPRDVTAQELRIESFFPPMARPRRCSANGRRRGRRSDEARR